MFPRVQAMAGGGSAADGAAGAATPTGNPGGPAARAGDADDPLHGSSDPWRAAAGRQQDDRGKRFRGDSRETAATDTVDPMDAVNAAIQASQDFLTAQLDSKLATVKAEIISEFATQLKGPLGAVVGQQQQQNAQFTGQIQSLQATSTKLEADQAELRAQITEMRQRLYMQEAQIPIKDYENLIEWDRPADTSIIVGTAAENFSLAEFKASIQPIIDKCEFGDGEWEAVGKSPSRRFLIQFSGDANASARRVRTFYSKLKGSDGEWLNTTVNSVHGQRTRLFLGLDRSGKTARREFQIKKLTQICKTQHDAKRWRGDRQQGIIYCNNLPVLSITVGSTKDEPTKLLFNYQGCLTHGINREDVKAKFEEIFQTSLDAQNVQWRL